ncbi:hypothetical protein IFM89_026765 [Coptis chinensis]|uniref:Signal peptidase complex-like protein DTM1 n=1 Tax=Coptis chinensis TaxID=261450 RepID=A0A835M8J8_9MAGN|nr:hypothetical protein IFM89_011750 [Coptis chinensis]KAF9621702.1 hypothetical protein IFM89_026765 [Coptis chinensis]
MANDAVLRTCLVCLGALVLLIGLYTCSFKKMLVTYAFGLLGIGGVLLPDWEFFDRDFSQWVYPMSTDDAQKPRSNRFRIYPMRLFLYTTVYSFGVYKWWMFVFNS